MLYKTLSAAVYGIDANIIEVEVDVSGVKMNEDHFHTVGLPDAAVRETWEETGLTVEITGVLGVYGGPDLIVDYPNGDQAAYIGTIFRGRILGGTMRPDGSEILDVRYFKREELMRVGHSRWMDRCMDVLFATNAPPHFIPPSWIPSQ